MKNFFFGGLNDFFYFIIIFNLFFREGEHFVSGGEDKLVKLWGYDEGLCYFSGTGHSGTITRVK